MQYKTLSRFKHSRYGTAPGRVTVWNNRSGRRKVLKASRDGSFTLRLGPVESVFVTY